MNNPLMYVDPSGYLPYNFIIWLNRWLYKNRTDTHSGTWRLGRTAKNRETTGPDGGEFFSYAPFDPWAGSGSSSTNSPGIGLEGRSGGEGSNGGGGSNSSSSSNSGNGDNASDDATWIQPPRQHQQAIDLRNPSFPSQIIERYEESGSSETIQDIINFSSAGDNWEKQIGDWGQIAASTKYETDSDDGKSRYRLFDLAGDNYPNGLIKIHVATSKYKGFTFRPHEIPISNIPKLKGNLNSTLQNVKYPYVISFYFQEFNLKGTYQTGVIGISYLFYDYNSFINIYNIL